MPSNLSPTFLPFGRIGRLRFAGTFIATGGLGGVSHTLRRSVHPIVTQRFNTANAIDYTSPELILALFGMAFSLWLFFIALVNRLHDIDERGWVLFIIPAPALIVKATQMLLPGSDGSRPLSDTTLTVAILVAIVISILAYVYIIFKCLFTRGDEGANRFGSEPN